MLQALFAVLLCQLLGEVIIRSLSIPIPGPVLGMGLMLILLYFSAGLRKKVQPIADTILGNLVLLFVPTGVGAVLQLQVLGWDFGPLLLALAVSTILALAATALTFQWAVKWVEGKQK